MEVVVAGGHGQVALRLLGLLAGAGHRAHGIIRDPAQTGDLEAVGAEALVCDLENEDPTGRFEGADAIVFAAGAGAGSGPERKRTVDYGAAVKLLEAARADRISRYVMLSAIGTRDPGSALEQMRPYIEAKAQADAEVADSGLDWTIVRPGSLTDDPGTGRVAAAPDLGRRGEVTRDDVAAVLLAALSEDNTIRRAFELLAGETPIDEALAAL